MKNKEEETFSDDDGKMWGPVKTPPSLEEILHEPFNRMRPMFAWRMMDRPTVDNVHPQEVEDTCDVCGRNKHSCDHYCLDCGELRDDCTYCGECDSHECTCESTF